jgi:hypothetical protein
MKLASIIRYSFSLVLFPLLFSCGGLSTQGDEAIDPRLSPEKKEVLKYQREIASLDIRKITTYLYDCESTEPRSRSTVLEEREFDEEGRLLKQAAYEYSGELRSRTHYFYGPEGDKTYQNLYNLNNIVIQTKYYDKLGYDTLTTDFLENGQVRSEMRKIVTLNPDGFPIKIEERDNLDRTHTVAIYSYKDEILQEETFTRFNVVSGDEVATQVIQYNEFGDRIYMSSSTASIIEDEVSMEYEYNKHNKIAHARLLNKDRLVIREKINSFYGDGTPSHISDYHIDETTGDTTRVYEENFNDSGKLVSYYMKAAAGNITQSGEFTYDKKKLLDAIEFNQEQNPNYICTYLEYEYYK